MRVIMVITMQLEWDLLDTSVLSSFGKYAVSENQSMIFLKLEDKTGLSLQERRTTERGASASVKVRKDKEGRRLSSVDHEKDRAVDAGFLRSDMTNEDVDDSQFVIFEKSIESIGFPSYASGPIQ